MGEWLIAKFDSEADIKANLNTVVMPRSFREPVTKGRWLAFAPSYNGATKELPIFNPAPTRLFLLITPLHMITITLKNINVRDMSNDDFLASYAFLHPTVADAVNEMMGFTKVEDNKANATLTYFGPSFYSVISHFSKAKHVTIEGFKNNMVRWVTFMDSIDNK
jgi:hypothetical protein